MERENKRQIKHIRLEGLSCADCAYRIERELRQLAPVHSAEINIATGLLSLELDGREPSDELTAQIEEVVSSVEPEAGLKGDSHQLTYNLPPELRYHLLRLAASALFFGMAFGGTISPESRVLLYGVSYLIAGFPILWKAVSSTIRGRLFDENFLMTLATIGALFLGEYPEAVAVMLFYGTGEFLQKMAVGRSRKAIAELMDIRPEVAHLQTASGTVDIEPEKVQAGERIVVRPGERVPLDGRVLDGHSELDTSALTGEPLPVDVGYGDQITSGTINLTGVLNVKVTQPFKRSTVSRILKLVEEAGSRKSPTERFITRFARYYTPVVVFAAILVAFGPPLILSGAEFSDWFYRALILLVISCPCALVISIPLGFFGGIGRASRRGILIKGSNYLDALRRVRHIVFDKTGTLTRGIFRVEKVEPAFGIEPQKLLSEAAHAEYHSRHPIARSIVRAYSGDIDEHRIQDFKEMAGVGVTARVDGKEIKVGGKRLLETAGIDVDLPSKGTGIHVIRDGEYRGTLVIDDRPKPAAGETIAVLKSMGVERVTMLTGDSSQAAERVARELGVDDCYTGLYPEDKVARLEDIMHGAHRGSGGVAFVGDGLNDAPVLARADIGVAMGGLGTDAAIEAADIVLMTDEIDRLPEAIDISKVTRRIVMENIGLALGVKAVVLIMGTMGLATLWGAVFADVGVALLAVLNSLRIVRG